MVHLRIGVMGHLKLGSFHAIAPSKRLQAAAADLTISPSLPRRVKRLIAYSRFKAAPRPVDSSR